MTTRWLDAVEINPAQQPQACLIWLHGLGADGHDFEPLIPELRLVEELGVRVILPHAPPRPVTINGGMVMRAWYDVLSPDFGHDEDDRGIRQSEQRLLALIAREVANGILPARIVLAGFSQGGVMALHTGLRYPRTFAGILALSCYLPLPESLARESSEASRAVPIMMAHGVYDPLIPLSLAEQSRDRLRQLGYTVDWYSYPMPHAVYPQEIRDIRQWLEQRFVLAGGRC
jgi:phospholipase/carboxylesterase